MKKLRDLINESKFLKREFGDPLVTFEDVMEKHQVNKFKEDLDSVGKEDDDVDNDGDSDASDDYLKNRRDVISKAIEKESIKEYTWDREFGDSLPTFKGVMKQHQVNKLKEDWWDDMDSASQAQYIKDHPSSKQAQQADAGGGEPEDKPFGGDTGKDADSGQEPSGEPTTPSIGDAKETYKKTKQERDDAVKELRDAKWAEEEAGMFGKKKAKKRVEDAEKRRAAAGENHKKAYNDFIKAREGQDDRQKDINSGRVEPENKEEADLAAKAARSNVEKQKQNRAYALNQPDPRDTRSPAEQEAGWNSTVASAEKGAEDAGDKAKEFGSARTGNELNQETLTIDGKQFRILNESVEKQPKPKYAFSEFYQRFKK
jgi:hypothetical protein